MLKAYPGKKFKISNHAPTSDEGKPFAGRGQNGADFLIRDGRGAELPALGKADLPSSLFFSGASYEMGFAEDANAKPPEGSLSLWRHSK